MKKALIMASVASMIQQFNRNNIYILKQLGYEVHVAANFNFGNTCPKEQLDALKAELEQINVRWYQIDFDRNVMNLKADIIAYRQILRLSREQKYDLIHCHSPIGGVIGRIVGHQCHIHTIYTAHGFHFYKGASKKNWLIFYSIEKFLSKYTEHLIVINKEDYALAKDKFKMKQLSYVPGVGIKTDFVQVNEKICIKKRQELGIPPEAFLIISVAEFTPNKNQITVLHAMEQMRDKEIYYIMCGIGTRKEELEQFVKEHGMEEKVKFLGFREDIHEMLQSSDCFVLSSIREGLSVALMEALAEGLPVVCTKIRGNVDLIEDGKGGYLVEPLAAEQYREAFERMADFKKRDPEKLKEMGNINLHTIQGFRHEAVDEKMREIYGAVVSYHGRI